MIQEKKTSVTQKKASVQEESPDNKEEINNYKLDVKPVFEFELLDVYLE